MKRRTVASLVAYSSLLTTWAFAQPEAPAPAAAPQPPASAEVDAAPKVDEAAAVLAPAPGGLTADTFAERTVASSHTVRAKLAELDASRARLNETTAQFFPRLTGKASYTRLSKVESGLGGALVGAQNPGPLGVGPCPGNPAAQCVLDSGGVPVGAASFSFPSLQNMYALSASLTVPISDYVLRLSNASAGASANRRAAELAVKAEKLKVRSDAQALYYDWLRAKARVAVAEKSLERTRARVKDAKPAYQLGVITKADLMRLEALAVSTEQVALEAKTFRDLAERQMAILMGDKKTKTFQVGEDVNAPRRPIPGELDDLTDEALSKRLELRALTEASRATRLAAKALKVGAYPRLDAFGDVTYANPNQRFFPQEEKWKATWSAGLVATWNVTDVFIVGSQSSQLDATARSLESQRNALSDGIRQEVAAHYLSRQKSEGALTSARRGVAASEEAYRVAVDLYRVGKATTTEVIEAETDLLAARLSEINARIELRIADVRLRHAVGRDVP
ncbi:MAG: TolC family protein [Polyangiaceae bacterium]|nr:TolC family protein [Polyangiaceae bacterium]MCL4755511.1 TolC family protein [Myxococcales bacterium]